MGGSGNRIRGRRYCSEIGRRLREGVSEKLTYGRRAMLRTECWSFQLQVSPEPRKGRRIAPDEMTWAATSPLEAVDVSLFDRRRDPAKRVCLLPRLPSARTAGAADPAVGPAGK